MKISARKINKERYILTTRHRGDNYYIGTLTVFNDHWALTGAHYRCSCKFQSVEDAKEYFKSNNGLSYLKNMVFH